jgi:UDPglucose--hexose-1-phosphate uridylyltransferase
MPELRKRLLTQEWVFIAPERAARPQRLHLDPVVPVAKGCPFCVSNPGLTPEPVAQWPSPSYPDAPWGVRSVPNRFPALTQTDETEPSAVTASMYTRSPATGVHEVIIEAPDHQTDWVDLPDEQIGCAYLAWRSRVRAIEQISGVRSVQLFKNQGARAGASLPHVHSQIAGLPLVPPRVQDEVEHLRRHHEAFGRCVLCDLVTEETRSGERLILATDHLVAIAPFASRVPYEVWLLPTLHGASFGDIEDAVVLDLASLTARVLRLWWKVLGPVDYNLILHTVPFAFASEPYYHWHLEMLPRVGQIAGFELSSGMTINAVASEVAASHLRDWIDERT